MKERRVLENQINLSRGIKTCPSDSNGLLVFYITQTLGFKYCKLGYKIVWREFQYHVKPLDVKINKGQ